MTGRDLESTLVDAYRRERLSFLQYVRQANPWAGPADRPLLDRVREMADVESAALDGLGDYLARNRMTLARLGAFRSPFTNYNFVSVRKLVKPLAEDEARGLAALERDAAPLPPGEARAWLERLAESKRMHLTELEKLGA